MLGKGLEQGQARVSLNSSPLADSSTQAVLRNSYSLAVLGPDELKVSIWRLAMQRKRLDSVRLYDMNTEGKSAWR
jgi:hypothetical protein